MSDIQQARDVLAKWRAQARPGRWTLVSSALGPISIDGDMENSEAVLADDVFEPDASLIVGTAGNPALLDAIDGLLWAAGSPVAAQGLVKIAERIAAAIVAADERMSA